MIDLDTIYAIKMPVVSNGLKRTFNKQLEVFVFERRTEGSPYIFQTDKKWMIRRKKWVAASAGTVSLKGINRENIYDEILVNSKHIQYYGYAFFSNLESAIDAKILGLDRLKREYDKTLDELRDLMERNCPDVNEEVKIIKQKHAEMFI